MRLLAVVVFCFAAAAVSAGVLPVVTDPSADRRPFDASPSGRWMGSGIAYGPFRDGQAPGKAEPSEAELLEDLHILARDWNMVRLYSSRGSAPVLCKLIREHKIPIRLMVGAWIGPEFTEKDGVRTQQQEVIDSNHGEIESAITLANAYPEVVMAIGVGNETQVSWSSHRSDPARLIAAIREVRSKVKCPVTTCDDFSYWAAPESKAVAVECDFIAAHLYAMWNKQQLPDALDWTREKLGAIEAMHPGVPVVVTEIGWATKKGTEGYQAIGVVATPGEGEQELFFRALRDWAHERKLPYFYFSAFDENWKGGASPDEIEKHWGVYNADRTPKRVMKRPTDRK